MLPPGRHLASCITESTSIQYATKCLGDHMSEQETEIRLEGSVDDSFQPNFRLLLTHMITETFGSILDRSGFCDAASQMPSRRQHPPSAERNQAHRLFAATNPCRLPKTGAIKRPVQHQVRR